ncbi:MAG: lipopolysaccharide heptosyltransferase family protein [Clostridia bacterium]|nr:lipopolysaccharide heptosyltransferase family protein [Clostridia bacterium]
MAKKEKSATARKILFQVHGGLGANIMKTAVVRQLRKENPDATIHVKASYPDVFKGLPYVDEYFAGPPQQIIHGAYRTYKDFEFMGEAEPYLDKAYRDQGCHMIEAACRRYGLGKPEKNVGDVILSQREKKEVKKVLAQILAQMPAAKDKKLIALQWTGGVPTFNQEMANDVGRITQARSLPKEVAQQVVDRLVKNDYAVLQISLPREESLNNVLRLYNDQSNQPLPIRYLLALLDECEAFIGIDSFAMHAWAALGKKNGLAVWGATSPKQLGYDSIVNLVPTNNPCDDVHCGRPLGFVGDFLGNGEPWTCPHDEACMKYNADYIVGKFLTMIADNQPKADKPEEPKNPLVPAEEKPAMELVEAEPVNP